MIDHLGELTRQAAHAHGDRVALVFEQRSFSFSEIDRLANRCANALRGIGVAPGDRVSLYAGNSWQWVVGYHGVLKCGAVINPINAMFTTDEVAYVLRDCGARVIISSAERGAELAALRATTPLEHVITFGGPEAAGTLDFERFVSGQSEDFIPVQRASEDLSTIAYTSGTTGRPKGAMLSHRSVVLNTALTATMHARTRLDTVVTALPCAHVYGNVVMNGCFMTGMTLVLMPRFDAGAAIELIDRHRATMFEGVPTMYFYMLAHPSLQSTRLESLTRCTVGGQTMPISKMEEVERRFGCPLIELWGMTELGGLGTTHPVYGPRALGSIGVAMPYVECRIADLEDAGIDKPTGEPGELLVRGPIVMEGYFNNETATRETITADGWLRTGDIAQRDANGCVFIVDRKKDMIITGGFKVFPAEIERVVSAHPAVALVAVGGMPDEVKGELAKVYVVLRPGASVSAEEIFAHCRDHLAAYKCPRALQFVSDLPKTSTGKIMRRQLRTLDGEGKTYDA